MQGMNKNRRSCGRIDKLLRAQSFKEITAESITKMLQKSMVKLTS